MAFLQKALLLIRCQRRRDTVSI